jgi:hypothetical protein
MIVDYFKSGLEREDRKIDLGRLFARVAVDKVMTERDEQKLDQ